MTPDAQRVVQIAAELNPELIERAYLRALVELYEAELNKNHAPEDDD